jgi:NTE family protein
MVRYMDITPFSSAGLADGNALMEFASREFGNPDISSVAMPYAAIATEMHSGREVWLRDGPIWDAARASMAMPGVMTPVRVGSQWMLDGGLVNPVPVSVCKALGADIIIAVNLNGDIVKRPRALSKPQMPEKPPETSLMDRITTVFREKSTDATPEWISPNDEKPGLFNVISSSINIMQDRITRSRLAGEPADLVITPRLNHIGLMEFNRAEEAIKEGRMSVRRLHSIIEHRIGATLQEESEETTLHT